MVLNVRVSFVNTFQVFIKEASIPTTNKGSFVFGGTTNPIPFAFSKIGSTAMFVDT